MLACSRLQIVERKKNKDTMTSEPGETGVGDWEGGSVMLTIVTLVHITE